MNPTSRPLFIVFEGIDGTGKSTQMRRLAERLTAEGIPITLTAEPTDMEEGHYLRRVLAGQVAADNAKIAALFLLDRIGHNVHPTQGIARMLADGKTVLSDRYYYSSMAYQGAGEDFPWVADMNLNCPAVRHPDGCIFLDMEPEDSMARIRARASEGVAELEIYETVAQQTAIRDRFLRAFDYVADRDFVVKVNAAGTVEEVADRVWSAYRVIAARAGLRAPDEKN